MEKRPVSLTIIAWVIIVGSVLSVWGIFRMQSNPMAAKLLAQSPFPLSVHVGFAVAGIVANLIAGYGILKGYPWSRWLYVGWALLSLGFSVATIPVPSLLLVSGLFLILIAFFLFRPAADAWFARSHAEAQ